MKCSILLITLVVASCGNSLPVRKHQLTKAEIQYRNDIQTLREMLAEYMNIIDDEATFQGRYI